MNTSVSVVGLAAAIFCGGSAGFVFWRFVGWMLEEVDEAVVADGEPVPEHAGIWKPGTLLLAGGLLAGGLWAWEVILGGMLPANASGPAATSVAIIARVAAHFMFFWLLAAAAWVDLRHRVIPDVITTPGVLVGLLVAWALPSCLLPIQVAQPRSFAAAVEVTDALAAWGPLMTGESVGMPVGLGVALAIFVLWWWMCTTPFLAPVTSMPAASGRLKAWLREPRSWVLLVGVTAISLASLREGPSFPALLSSLIGLAVSAGLVWLTRTGATVALGREAMGMGDVTLMAMVGAWLGWQPAVMTFFLATFLGLGHGVFQMIRHRENELPYGPSLCLAAALVTVGWSPLWRQAELFFVDAIQLGLMLGLVVVLTAVTLFIWRWLRGLGDAAA